MKNIFILFIAIILISGNPLYSQFSVTNDSTIADPSAMLDVKSTNRGALIPRMTQAQIGNIENPANGLLVFCTTDNKFYTFIANDNTWKEILYGTGTITPPPLSCGNLMTINHSVSFGVAPVDKQVTYGTVTGIPGEPTKCWITSNLGADHPATALNDPSEASAGWYWQFNRKQGYRHDGTTRIPNTYWINDINEASDWIISNDPCNIEFGASWRIPTYTEWYNVDNNGGWINWNGPWGSVLNLHAAGLLYFFSGSLYYRGSYGFYWSNTRNNTRYSLGLTFAGNYSSMSDYEKAYGFSVRCLKDAGSSPTPTVATSSISNITDTSASSGGKVTSNGGATVTARGVCWGTSSNPIITDSHTTDGSGTGSFFSDLTGLTLNTIYFVRAYATNSFGTVYGNEETFATLNPCPGIETITINHLVSGGVAPVNKIVTYGTVTNISGYPSKCWISSNLGADHLATDVSDDSEASAGWYWQFNRKQGYKHDGITRTPNTTWITSISENSEWITTNDPCTIELGTPWHIPTLTEWDNVDNNGGWNNWNDPWSSGLKLHAAGMLDRNDGSLLYRGSYGYYWSSAQSSATGGWYLYFDHDFSIMTIGASKAYGKSVRCIREISFPLTTPSVTTSSVSNITLTSASSGGNVFSDGGSTVTTRGVCWSTSSNPTIADSNSTDGSGTGSFLSDLTGLTLNTIYFVRAYATNSFGTAYGNEKTFETLNLCPGIETITINHLVSGGVAPVNKTVTYGTVTNISGDTSKCWITSNLGADHLATDVSDDTEASAGWYWQFNRKQGYMHDGTNLTPNTTWLTSISENSDWTAANDPCSIELGTSWYIPTYTEWYNFDNTGGWINWNFPWGSGLYLHAAGYLQYTLGSLLNRGLHGKYWSSVQNSATAGWFLYFDSGVSYMNVGAKAYGHSVRCLRDASSPLTTPTVTTSYISNITLTSASSGGNVTSDGGTTVTARGVCWNTSSNPTIADSHTTDGSGTGTFVSSLTGLTANTFYYFRAYATNSLGTSYGNQGCFTTTLSFAIGQSYGGGIIFYIDCSGQHGLIAATTDQSSSTQWGCSELIGTSTEIGTGQTNTTLIVNGCSTPVNAARICDDLVLNGYNDWFLPSRDELNQMYLQKTVIGGFANYYYWSSSEEYENEAWIQHFGDGAQYITGKGWGHHVRAVRAF